MVSVSWPPGAEAVASRGPARQPSDTVAFAPGRVTLGPLTAVVPGRAMTVRTWTAPVAVRCSCSPSTWPPLPVPRPPSSSRPG